MTAEQLEELMVKADPDNDSVSFDDWLNAGATLAFSASSLARRVIASEKLVDALDELPLGDGHLAQLVTAYREANK